MEKLENSYQVVLFITRLEYFLIDIQYNLGQSGHLIIRYIQ